MDVTGKDILNLACAVKIVKTTYRNGYSIFTNNIHKDIASALEEAIDKYRQQLKEN